MKPFALYITQCWAIKTQYACGCHSPLVDRRLVSASTCIPYEFAVIPGQQSYALCKIRATDYDCRVVAALPDESRGLRLREPKMKWAPVGKRGERTRQHDLADRTSPWWIESYSTKEPLLFPQRRIKTTFFGIPSQNGQASVREKKRERKKKRRRKERKKSPGSDRLPMAFLGALDGILDASVRPLTMALRAARTGADGILAPSTRAGGGSARVFLSPTPNVKKKRRITR